MIKTAPRAFSILELVVTLVIIGLMLALLLPALSMARRLAYNTTCKANLRQVFHQSIAYFADYDYHMPWMTTQAWTYEPNVLLCPADNQPTILPPELTGAQGDIAISYGFNPEFALTNKRYTQLNNPSRVLLAYEALHQLSATGATADETSDDTTTPPPINGSQVTITHFPPGDRDNPQVITIPLTALKAHLAHGDILGDWMTPSQGLNPTITLQNDFVKRHRDGQTGNILFADGYVLETDKLPADALLSHEDDAPPVTP